MEHDIPAYPNPAVVGLLRGSEMRALMFERAEMAKAIYQDIVSKRTGRLARSAHSETFIGGAANDRWCGRLTVGDASAYYGVSHEFGTDDGDNGIHAGFHDLNVVLNSLGAL